MGGEGAGAVQDHSRARGWLGPRGGACSPGSGAQGLSGGAGLVSAGVVVSGEELGRAVPSRCGETRAGRQLEAVPPPCSISGGWRSRCEAGLCSSQPNPAAHVSR